MPLLLPQVHIFFDSDRPDDRSQVLVLGGRAPEAAWLRSVASGRVVWAADHGADACMHAGVVPHHVWGDFDSITSKSEEWLRRFGSDVEIKRFPAEKDYTDFQLCLNRAHGDILVTGCWGGRFDHAFANVFSALWGFEWGAEVRAFADESEVLVPLAANESPAALELRFLSRVSAISLLPLCEVCEGVDIIGTRWELSGATLRQGRPYAVSNLPAEEGITVKIGSGIVGVYCFMENGPAHKF